MVASGLVRINDKRPWGQIALFGTAVKLNQSDRQSLISRFMFTRLPCSIQPSLFTVYTLKQLYVYKLNCMFTCLHVVCCMSM